MAHFFRIVANLDIRKGLWSYLGQGAVDVGSCLCLRLCRYHLVRLHC